MKSYILLTVICTPLVIVIPCRADRVQEPGTQGKGSRFASPAAHKPLQKRDDAPAAAMPSEVLRKPRRVELMWVMAVAFKSMPTPTIIAAQCRSGLLPRGEDRSRSGVSLLESQVTRIRSRPFAPNARKRLKPLEN